jgi:hypothetical protein
MVMRKKFVQKLGLLTITALIANTSIAQSSANCPSPWWCPGGSKSTSVSASGTQVNVGANGVNVSAPGTNVAVGANGVTVTAPNTNITANNNGVNVEASDTKVSFANGSFNLTAPNTNLEIGNNGFSLTAPNTKITIDKATIDLLAKWYRDFLAALNIKTPFFNFRSLSTSIKSTRTSSSDLKLARSFFTSVVNNHKTLANILGEKEAGSIRSLAIKGRNASTAFSRAGRVGKASHGSVASAAMNQIVDRINKLINMK